MTKYRAAGDGWVGWGGGDEGVGHYVQIILFFWLNRVGDNASIRSVKDLVLRPEYFSVGMLKGKHISHPDRQNMTAFEAVAQEIL